MAHLSVPAAPLLLVLVAAAVASLSIEASAAAVQADAVGHRRVGSHFVRGLAYKQELRICNAYPFGTALDIYNGKQKLTKEALPYKNCASLGPKLHEGDRIEFMVGDASAGTFTISELPTFDAVLLIVVSRHDAASSAVTFDSHVFSAQSSPQIAVLDTYRGKSQSELRIQAPPAPPPPPPKNAAGDAALVQVNETRVAVDDSELLRYSNVVAVDPGAYEVFLREVRDTQAGQKAALVALASESYVVLRCGADSQNGDAYPQELMVYPNSDKALLPHAPTPVPGAAGRAGVLAALPAVLAAWLLAMVAA